MRKLTFLITLSLFNVMSSLVAQADSITMLNPIEKLDFVIGEWKGTGWTSSRKGKEYTNVTEIAKYKLENSIIVVEGLGIKTDSLTNTSKVVHDAFGIISFDHKSNSYSIRAYKKEGITESKIEFIEEKIIQWKLKIPNGGQVRFTADYTVEDTWVEIGEFSRDGINWIQILGMKLKKIK